MTCAVTIPTLETDRLILRAPLVSDFDIFAAFMETDRTKYIGGSMDLRGAARIWGNFAGQWVLRGYGSFVACLRDGTPIGGVGLWHPMNWPEPEFGWTLWSPDHEGHGYITEAMRRIMPWAWGVIGTNTAVSFIDAPNAASAGVAQRLGAQIDAETTATLNAAGGLFHDPDGKVVNVWRHQKGALQ